MPRLGQSGCLTNPLGRDAGWIEMDFPSRGEKKKKKKKKNTHGIHYETINVVGVTKKKLFNFFYFLEEKKISFEYLVVE